MKLILPLLALLTGLLLPAATLSAGTLVGVRSVKFTNTRADWFYIEEIRILNHDGVDVASLAFGSTAAIANFGGAPAFGSTLQGAIDDIFGNCCGTGTHSANNVSGHAYTVTFPTAQTVTGDITMWNRQDGCCPERLDGFQVEFFTGDNGGGLLLASVQVDNLAASSGGAISTPTGASFPVPFPPDDADGDGLPDQWEIDNGLDENDNGENPNNNGVPGNPDNGVNGDPDMDGLTNGEELSLGTHPMMADTDSDGLNDNVETDDGVYVDETATGTDPLNPDTDGDGLLDGVENNTGVYESEAATGTDPHNPDTDGDGLLDGVENPSLPFDPNDPENQPGTDPNKADTDGDGINDRFEITAGSDPTDPDSVPPPQPPGTLNGVRSVKVINTRPDWFYLEELEILNTLNLDVASLDFESTATHTGGTPFGSSTNGGIDDAINNCCGTGWHSEEFLGTPQYYIVTFPAGQNLHGDITVWNRQDACCPERLDGMLFEFWSGPEGTGTLLGSQQVDNLAIDSGGAINTATGASFTIEGPLAPPRVDLAITLDVDELVFTWTSRGGKLYTLRSETDPSIDLPLDWPVFDSHESIEATPPTNTLAIGLPADAARYFVIEEFNAPPVSVFTDDFESGAGAWTTGGNPGAAPGTLWELGAPANVGPLAANSGTNCWGTNLGDYYTLNADIFLRSPPIDLATAGGATLNFAHYADIEETFDAGTVAVLDATDNTELAVLQEVVEGFFDWTAVSLTFPPQALGKTILLEFRFFADDFAPIEQAGWYIDDINVTVP